LVSINPTTTIFVFCSSVSKKVPIFEGIKQNCWIKERVMTTSPIYSCQRMKVPIVTSFTLFFLLLISVFSYGQLGLSCSISKPISCNGVSDGEITATGSNLTNYQYSSDLSNWYPDPGDVNPYVFTGLGAGTYRIYVRDADNITDTLSQLVVLTEPDVLSFTLGGQNWSCASPGCSGSITVTPAGGTSPYTVSLNSVAGTPPFTGLCDGSYTVDVVDANLCTTPPQDTSIVLDNTPPTGCSFPADVFLTGYVPESKLDTLHFITAASPVVYVGAQLHPYPNDTLIYGGDMSASNDIQFKIAAFQNDVEQWDGNDFIEVSYSLNSGASWTVLLKDYCRWQANNDTETGSCAGNLAVTENDPWINIPNAAGVSGFQVRVVCMSGSASRSYTIQRLMVRRNNTLDAVSLAQSGQPTGCVDNYSPVTTTHTDSLLHWYCNTTGNLEFKFQRIWYVSDQCQNRVRHVQNISVGTIPTFSPMPRDTIFDFCHNAGQVVTGPTPSDNCYLRSITWTSTGATPASGTTNTPTITFTRPVKNDTTYVITWTVTDSAGFTNWTTQTIRVLRPINIVLTPSIADFCSGVSVSFTISGTGGTGRYEALVPGGNLTPNGTWIDPENDGIGNYTTSNLTPATPDIQVTYTDLDISGSGGVIGGCPVTANFRSGIDGYTVHQKIVTNPLERP
jgi:hypothetical protein